MNPGEKPEEAALREMLEETGFTAKKIYHGATVSPNPAIMSNHCHFFIAEDLQDTRETHLDEDEYVTVERIPVQTVQERMGQPPFIHALMMAALFAYQQKKALHT